MYLQNKLQIAITDITTGGGFNHTNKTNGIRSNKNRSKPPNLDAIESNQTHNVFLNYIFIIIENAYVLYKLKCIKTL